MFKRRWCPFKDTQCVAILNYLFLLINKVSKTQISLVLLFCEVCRRDAAPRGCSHSLIIFLSAAFVRRKVKWVFKNSKSALRIK